MTSNRYSFLKIPQKNDVDVTYKICLDDLDLSLLPINQLMNRYNGGKELTLWDVDGSLKAMEEYSRVEDEICNFEVYAQKNVDGNSEIKASPKSIFCHLCNLNIPAAFIKNHIDSDKHADLLKLSNEVLARTSKQLNEIFYIENTATETENGYYCETCNIIIKNHLKEHHETEKKHISLLKRDQLLGKLFEIYSEDQKKFDNIVDIRAEKEKVEKCNEKKVNNCEKCNSNKQIAVDKTQINSMRYETSVNIDLNGKHTVVAAKTASKQKNIDSESKATQKNIEVSTYKNKLCTGLNLNKPQIGAEGETNTEDTQIRTIKKGHETVNIDNKTNQNCLLSNGHKQNIMESMIIIDNKIINQETNKKKRRKGSAQINSKIAIKGQGQNLKTTNETNKASFHVCEICKVNVPNNSDDIRTHNEGRPHKKNQDLNINGLQKDSAPIISKSQGQNMKTTNETNKASNFHVCAICRVNVPYNDDNLRAHNAGRPHKKNIEHLQNLGVTDSSNTEASNSGANESQNSLAQSKNKKNQKEALAGTHKNVVSETKENKNNPEKVKIKTSLQSNKSQNCLNENKQLVSHKNQKEQLGDTTNKQKIVKIEKNNILKENKSTTFVAPTKRQNNFTDDNNSENRKKHTEQMANARIPTTQNNLLSENELTENDEIPKEIKASSSRAVQNSYSANEPLKNHQQLTDTTKTKESIKSKSEQTENDDIPMELIKNSKRTSELVHRMNDAETLQWILDNFDSLIAVPTMSGNVLMMSRLNYHGLKVEKWIECLICDTDYEIVPCFKFFYEHIASKRHVDKLNINEENGLRLGRHNTVHCVLCNISIQSSTAVNYHLNSGRHRNLEEKALVDPKDEAFMKNHTPNDIKTESDATNQTIGAGHRFGNCSEENDEDLNNRESESETGDYISKLMRKSYYENCISSYKLLQLFWSYITTDTFQRNYDTLKLRFSYFHGIHVIDESNSFSCLLCQKHNNPISYTSITYHIESSYHRRKSSIRLRDANGLREVRTGFFHCALCNVYFEEKSISEHISSSMHQEVLGKDPEPQFYIEDANIEPTESPEPETTSTEPASSSCVII